MTYTCGICGELWTESIDKLRHTHAWGNGVVTTEATETAEGVKTFTCSCGETKEEAIPMLDHNHSLTFVEAKATSCTVAGNIAYFSCECGRFFSDAEGTDEIAAESWVIPAAHATVLDETVGYWVCTGGCGQYFEDEAATKVIDPTVLIEDEGCEHTMKHMEAVDTSCTVPGTAAYWFCTTCGGRYADAEGKEEIEYIAHTEHAFSGYTWDFSKGSATSTNGGRTLSLVKTGVSGTTAVEDLLTGGELVASSTTTMQLSESVTLSTSEDWTVELVAKGYEGVTMRSFLSTEKTLAGVYFYITNGDLSLVSKVAYTPDGATTALKSGYTYYKVSDVDYAASPMGQGTFDQTQYHTYQLRCVDGVISY